MIIDSWLIDNGTINGLDLHLKRFRQGVREFYGREFSDAELVPARHSHGTWFSRLSFDGERLDFQLRPVPPQRRTSTLWVPSESDPRHYPHLKGPDMLLQQELRQRAQQQGAHEAVLHLNGYVVEASMATLLFLDGPTLIRPEASRLPSITEKLLCQRWRGPVLTRRINVEELHTLGILCLSSLHGVTEVENIHF